MFLQAFGNNSGIIGYKNSVHIACKNYDSDNSGKYKSFVLNVADFEDVFGFKEMEGAIITSLSDSAPFPKQIILQTEVPVSIVNTTRQYKFIQLDLKEGQPGQLYTIIVNGGTSDKTTAKAGETVTLTPNNIDDFAYWEVNDAQIEGNTFIMPSENVVCNAIYRQSPSHDKITPTKEDIVVYGRIVSGSTEGVIADSVQIWDESLKKNQRVINNEFVEKYKQYLPLSGGVINGNLTVFGTGDFTKITLGDSLNIEENRFELETSNNESLFVGENGLLFCYSEDEPSFQVKEGSVSANNIYCDELSAKTQGGMSIFGCSGLIHNEENYGRSKYAWLTNGDVISIGGQNGLATLDQNGNIPVSQLEDGDFQFTINGKRQLMSLSTVINNERTLILQIEADKETNSIKNMSFLYKGVLRKFDFDKAIELGLLK